MKKKKQTKRNHLFLIGLVGGKKKKTVSAFRMSFSHLCLHTDSDNVSFYVKLNLSCLIVYTLYCIYIICAPCNLFSSNFQINRRGMPPKGGGEILFACPVRKVLQPIQFTDPGKIKRIRGTAYPSLTFFLNKIAFKGKK